VAREIGVWPAVEQTIKNNDVNLIALGTQGRTGTLKPPSTESRILALAVYCDSLQASTCTEQLFQIEVAPHRTFSHGLTFGFHGPLTFD
jgi:hypothetical protein